jgi:hypothetical protein
MGQVIFDASDSKEGTSDDKEEDPKKRNAEFSQAKERVKINSEKALYEFLKSFKEKIDLTGNTGDFWKLSVLGFLEAGYYKNAKGVMVPYAKLKYYNPTKPLSEQKGLSKAFAKFYNLGKNLERICAVLPFVSWGIDEYLYSQGASTNESVWSSRLGAAFSIFPSPLNFAAWGLMLTSPNGNLDPLRCPNVVKHSDVINGKEVVWYDYVCFKAGTIVSTKKGDLKIEEIHVGDSVYSFNFEKNNYELKQVVNFSVYKSDAILEFL